MGAVTPGPRYFLPPWDETLSMANEAISASTPTAVLSLGAEADHLVVSLAAAARCRRLMMSVVALAEAGLTDVIGGLLRSLYETWLVGTYALLGERPAIGRLLAQTAEQEKRLARALGLPTDDLPDGKPFPVIDLATEVTKLLEAQAQEHAAFARLAYDVFYRVESHRSTHGGLGSILDHVVEDDSSRRILEARPEDDARTRHRVLLGVALLVSAAQMPARRAGLPHDRLDQIGQRLLSLKPPDDPLGGNEPSGAAGEVAQKP